MGLVGAVWCNSDHGNSVCIKNIREDISMKKNIIYAHKLYSPKDIERRMGIKEEKIIALLEKERTKGILGRKILGFWFIRGKQVIEIQKLLKDKKSG